MVLPNLIPNNEESSQSNNLGIDNSKYMKIYQAVRTNKTNQNSRENIQSSSTSVTNRMANLEKLIKQDLRFEGDTHILKRDINNYATQPFIEKCRLTLNIFHNHQRDQKRLTLGTQNPLANNNRRYKSNPRGETTIFKDIKLDSIKEQNEQMSPDPEVKALVKMETESLPKTIKITPKEPDSSSFL